MADWEEWLLWLQKLLNKLEEDKDFSKMKEMLLKLMEVIYFFMKDALKNSGDEESSSDKEKVKREIVRLVDQLNKSHKAKKIFLEKFPNWKRVRQDNIKLLKEIGDKINSDRFNCNVSKLVGSSVSLAGGTVGLISAILIPFTLGLSTPFAIAGGVATGLGTATTFGASVAEFTRLKNDVERAQKICEEDKEQFKYMKEWIDSSEELVKSIDDVIGFDLVQTLIGDFQKVSVNAAASSSAISTLSDTLLTFLKEKTLPNLSKKDLAGCLKNLKPVIVSFIFASFCFHTKNRLLIDGVVASLHLAYGIAMGVGYGTDTACKIATFLKRGAPVGTPVGKAIASGTFAVLGMALDIANIALTSIDVQNGSTSEQGREILNASEQMKQELDRIEKIYNKLKEDK